jgi:hypothetical protein
MMDHKQDFGKIRGYATTHSKTFIPHYIILQIARMIHGGQYHKINTTKYFISESFGGG